MIELKVGMRVKALKSNQRDGNYEGKIGIIVRADGDWMDHPAYLVSFGEDKRGWFLADELEIQERRERIGRRLNTNIYDGEGNLVPDQRRRYDRRRTNYTDFARAAKKTSEELHDFHLSYFMNKDGTNKRPFTLDMDFARASVKFLNGDE